MATLTILRLVHGKYLQRIRLLIFLWPVVRGERRVAVPGKFSKRCHRSLCMLLERNSDRVIFALADDWLTLVINSKVSRLGHVTLCSMFDSLAFRS